MMIRACESFGEFFLQDPEMFPARQSGEPWGDEIVALDLPGGPYNFSGLDASQLAAVKAKMGDFVVSNLADRNLVKTRVFRAAESDFRSLDLRGWEYSLDIDCRESFVRCVGLDFMARLDWRPHLAGAVWIPTDDSERFLGAFENYFRVLVSYQMVESGGVLIHSAGVLSEGRAHLFAGHSGAGKTTLSRLSIESGKAVLSVDLNAIQPTDSGPTVSKLPFTGELGPTSGANGKYPLQALYRLKQGEEHGIQSMSRGEAVATLAACAPNVNLNPHRQDRLLSNLESVVSTVPLHVLTFCRDGRFWELLDEGA
jgi:antitoxin (DNA-binding transcriptional repressor) of toxin-antitoxin stability system